MFRNHHAFHVALDIYHVYLEYSDTLTPHHTYPYIWTSILLPVIVSKNCCVSNSVDPDQTSPYTICSDVGK